MEPPPFFGGNESELRACSAGFTDHASGLACEIDGVPLEALEDYRHQSPLFSFTVPVKNILGVPAGTTGLSVDDGVYLLLLPPLPVGDHTIHFTGTFDVFGATIDTTGRAARQVNRIEATITCASS